MRGVSRSPDFHGEVIAAPERLRTGDPIRSVDVLVISQDDPGDVEVTQLSNPTGDRAVGPGSLIGDRAVGPGSFIGDRIRLGEDGAEGTAVGAVAGGNRADGSEFRTIGAEDREILQDVRNGSAALRAADAAQKLPVRRDHRTPNPLAVDYTNRNTNDLSSPDMGPYCGAIR